MKMIGLFIILSVTALTHGKICPPEKLSIKNRSQLDRLPNDVIPSWYNLTLDPNFEDEIFTGSVTIEVKFVKQTDRIVLHNDRLSINQGDVHVRCDKEIAVTGTESNLDNNFFTVNLNETISVNQICFLHIDYFQGILSDTEPNGFYLAKYIEDGVTKVMATTQFQFIAARKAFPCFDEPHLKARFVVNLIRPNDYISISNEKLEHSISLSENRVKDVFKETKVMSTYPLAFVVSQYSSTEVKERQRVFSYRSSIENGDADFALDMGIKILSTLEDYTKIDYSFSKMDQIGIPDEYFWAGAMENWGLVTYRQSILVYPYNQAFTKTIEQTVSIIAHEFAHQWFGNLVTCSWWKYTWLNEGFANYFQYFASAMVGWEGMKELYVSESIHSALEYDSDIYTQPMNSEQASSIIFYQKAGAVIRMLSHFVTEDIFHKSLILYLSTNQYKSTTPDQLYQAFQTVLESENKTHLLGGLTVSNIMTTWDSQPGYPVLYVTKNDNNIVVEQERFFTDGNQGTETWIIPLTYVTENQIDNDFSITTANDWMTGKQKVIDVNTNGWVILNKQQVGYYRVMYDKENLRLISNQLSEKDHNQIHLFNRAQLLDDTSTFAELHSLQYSDFLELSKYLVKEHEYVPISIFSDRISNINLKLSKDYGRDDYKIFMEGIFSGSVLDVVGLEENETDAANTKYLRILLLNWLCKLGNEKCTTYTLETFRSNSVVSRNVEGPIYCGAMRRGNQLDWNKLFEKYKNENDSFNRSIILNGLGCSENHDTLTNFIELILDTNNGFDAVSSFSSILDAGDFGIEFLLNYLMTSFDRIKHLPDINQIIYLIGEKLNTQEDLDKYFTLAGRYPDYEFNSVIYYIYLNVQWNKDYGEDIKNWLAQYKVTR